MKYWVVAQKLELIRSGRNPNQNNTRNQAIFVSGIVFNVVGGLTFGIPLLNDWIIILEQVM